MRLMVVTILVGMIASSSFSNDSISCLERFEYQQSTVAGDVLGRVGDFFTNTSSSAMGRDLTGNLLILAKKIQDGKVELPETAQEANDKMVYNRLANIFLSFKDYQTNEGASLKGISNLELANKMIQADLNNDPIQGQNPFCTVRIRSGRRNGGQERFQMRIFKTNRRNIARALLK